MKQSATRPPEPDRHKKQVVFRRTVELMVIFGILVFLPLMGKLFQLQITEHEFYQEKAAEQQTRDLAVSADRGAIYDSEGNVLAISATVQNLVVSPKDILENGLDQNLIAVGLAQLTGLEPEDILARMTRTNSQYEVVKRKLEEEDAQAVRAFIKDNKLAGGVYLEPDSKRYYPYSSLASHVIGFVGTDNTGLYGAEMSFNETLSGTAGRVVTAKNGRGTELLSPYENYIDAQDGLDHHLTINATIQGFLEKALEEGVAKYDVSKGAFGIVMDPNTGGILAMASVPDYDLNNYSVIADPTKAEELAQLKADPSVSQEDYKKALGEAQLSQWRNRCITDTYEPGSTFKTVVLASALEEGVVNLQSRFYCSGGLKVGGFYIHCSRHSGHGEQDLTLAVKNSCNPAFMDIGQRLGAERFYDYLEDFGVLNTTGIDLGGELGSQVWGRKYFTSEEGISSLATASFGQTMRLTPIQLITAASAAVNGGHLLTPHVLDYVTDSEGRVVERTQVQEIRQVVSEETSATVRNILEQVVASGTGKNTYQPGYRIGGKTGTSEKIGVSAEEKDDLIVSFLGVAPANEPKIVVLLAFDTPTPVSPGSDWTAGGVYISGGNMAAPSAGPLMAQILDYLGVEKQYSAQELSGADTAVPQTVGYTEEQAAEILKKRGFTYRKVGEGGKVTAQIPATGAVVPGGSQIVLYMGVEKPTETVEVPDLSSMSPDAARAALQKVNLLMRASGPVSYFTSSTLAAGQSIAPGTSVAQGTVVEVTFVEYVNDFSHDQLNHGR